MQLNLEGTNVASKQAKLVDQAEIIIKTQLKMWIGEEQLEEFVMHAIDRSNEE